MQVSINVDMNRILSAALAEVLANQGDKANVLTYATQADLDVYSKHWQKLVSTAGSKNLNSIPTSDVTAYLASNVIEEAAVTSIVEFLGLDKSHEISIDEFQAAAHLCYATVHVAQENIFNDEFLSDGLPASDNKRLSTKEKHQENWRIGVVLAAHEAESPSEPEGAAAEGEVEQNDDDEATCNQKTPTGASKTLSFGEVDQSPSSASSVSPKPPSEEATTAPGWASFEDAFAALAISRNEQQVAANYNAFANFETASVTSSMPSTISLASPSSQGEGGDAPISSSSRKIMVLPGISVISQLDQTRCRQAYAKHGYGVNGGLTTDQAMRYFDKSLLPQQVFDTLWSLADVDKDGVLSEREFTLFVHLLRAASVSGATVLPESISSSQVEALFGCSNTVSSQRIRLPTETIRSALGRTSAMNNDTYIVDDETASQVSTDMASTWSDHSCPPPPTSYRSAYAPYNTNTSSRPAAAAALDGSRTWLKEAGGHTHLQMQIIAADVKYTKMLDRPFITLSIVDGQGRLIELPQDTHPGRYRRETSSIYFNHVVTMTSALKALPAGAALLLEIKHWKSSSKKFSTLAWGHVLIEAFVDSGPVVCKVRDGPFLCQLYKKPVEQNVARARPMGGQAGRGLHLLVKGVVLS